jgi:membrane-bound ClpP family serine protease
MVDPNVIYLVLLSGLWLGATATYIPGTGLAELASLGLIGVAIVWMLAASVQWLALAALIVGVAFFLVTPLLLPQYSRYAIAGLGLQALGALFLFPNGVVSPILIGVTLLASFAYWRMILAPIMRNQAELRDRDQSNPLLGAEGRVTKALDPVGTVIVNGESWTARSSRPIPVDSIVEVTEQLGLELRVRAKRQLADRSEDEAADQAATKLSDLLTESNLKEKEA